jgi:2Fe-2S ferredoxin
MRLHYLEAMADTIQVTLIDHRGAATQLEVEVGQSIMEAAVIRGVKGVPAECGGAPTCGTCSVFVPEEWAARTGTSVELEREVLELHNKLDDRRRLSCQLIAEPAWDGLTLHIPESQY